MRPLPGSRPLDRVWNGLLSKVRWRDQASRLFDLELGAKTAEVRENLWLAKGRQRRHDLVNAFMAVEGASIILGRESLSASDRTKLMEVLESGMTRLRAIIVSEAGATERTVELAEVAATLSEEEPWDGRLQLAVEPGLVAAAMPYETTEAARQLLAYCSARAPITPLTLRGVREADGVALWVEDRGPEMPDRSRRSFTQAVRSWAAGPDEVTGLDVAILLVQQQGGAVRIRPRGGGGMSFGICLPGAGARAGDPRGT